MRFLAGTIRRAPNVGRLTGAGLESPPGEIDGTSTSSSDTTLTPEAGPNRLAKSIVIENWLFASV